MRKVRPQIEQHFVDLYRPSEIDGETRLRIAVDAPTGVGPEAVIVIRLLAVDRVPCGEDRFTAGFDVGAGMRKKPTVGMVVPGVECQIAPGGNLVGMRAARIDPMQASLECLLGEGAAPIAERYREAMRWRLEISHRRSDGLIESEHDMAAVRAFDRDAVALAIRMAIDQDDLVLPRYMAENATLAVHDLQCQFHACFLANARPQPRATYHMYLVVAILFIL